MPEYLYGIRKDAAFNPQRDVIFPQVYIHPAIFQWNLIAASSHYCAQGGQLDVSYTMRRRSKVYRLINEGLSDPKQYLSDGLLASIHAAVMVESRYGDSHATRHHIEGLKNFLKRKGGKNSVVGKPWHVCIFRDCI